MLKGANAERTAILAHLRRLLKKASATDILIAWMLQRNERYNARSGGLGK